MADLESSIHVVNGVYGEEPYTYYPVLVVGGGASGIAMGCRMKSQLGFDQFRIFERQSGPGGVWWRNRYPGVACDVPSIFYSFSFMPNIDATGIFSKGADIVRYFRKICHAYQISDKLQFDTDVAELHWLEDEELWEATILHLLPGKGDLTSKERKDEIAAHGQSSVICGRERIKAKMVISCVGGIVEPRDLTGEIPGLESFQGPVFHSSRWDPNADLNDKDVVVLGAGCSAAQLVPEVVKSPHNARSVTQIMRSPPWVIPKPVEVEPDEVPLPTELGEPDRISKPKQLVGPENSIDRSSWDLNWAYIGGRLRRLMIFHAMESEFFQLFRTSTPKKSSTNRAKVGAAYLAHMKNTVPERYHTILTPDHEVGCKRRLFDNTWLSSLNNPQITLTTGEIESVQPKSVTLSAPTYPKTPISNGHANGHAKEHTNGYAKPNSHTPPDSPTDINARTGPTTIPCDALILANGFDIGSWLHPLTVHGRQHTSIHDLWATRGGAQAYMGTAMDQFPNFFMIFGPNTVTGHSSVILAAENQVEYALKFVDRVVVRKEWRVCEIKERECRAWVGEVQRLLKKTVWGEGRSTGTWYVKEGWNSVAYPRSQIDFGLRCMFPKYSDWDVKYTRKGMFRKRMRALLWYGSAVGLLSGGLYATFLGGGIRQAIADAWRGTRLSISSLLIGAAQKLSYV